MESVLFRDHLERKERVLNFINKTAELYGGIEEYQKVKESLDSLAKETENGSFSIVVVGQFSSGKSTLLNALMGEKYLPSFTTETTATINFLRSLKESPEGKPMVRINYRDGHIETSEDVSLEGIQKFVAINENLNVKEKVKSVEVFLDSKFLTDGVSLVDSPGLNGMAEGHREITMDQINRSHAAIFLFNARQPGSLRDFEELNNLINLCPSLFIVLNQIDLVNKSEQSVEDVVQNVLENYGKYFQTEKLPKLFPVSAYKALVGRSKKDLEYLNRRDYSDEEKRILIKESLMEQFEDRLFRYLTQGEKTLLELKAPVQKAVAFLTDSFDDFSARVKDLKERINPEKLEDEINILNEKIEKNKRESIRERNELSDKINELFKSIRDEVVIELDNMSTRFRQSISDMECEDLIQTANDFFKVQRNLFHNLIDTKKTVLFEEYRKLILNLFGEYCESISEVIGRVNYGWRDGENPSRTISEDALADDSKLDETEKKLEELEDRLFVCMNEYDENTYKLNNAERDKETAQTLQQQKEDARQTHIDDLTALGQRPAVDRVKQQTTIKIGGIRMWLNYAWSGKSGMFKQKEVDVQDTSRRDEWERNRKLIEEDYQERMSEINERMRALDPNSASYEIKERQLRRQQEMLSRRIEETKKEIEDGTKKAQESHRRRVNAQINQFLNEIRIENLSEFDNWKADIETQMVSQAVELLDKGVTNLTSNEIQKLESRIRVLREDDETRKATLDQFRIRLDDMKSLKQEGESLLSELDEIQPDQITKD